MARELIVDLEATFSDGEYYGDLFGLVVGEKYTVVWGDEEFPDLTAVQATLLGHEAIVIGNQAIAGAEDTGEPFLIGETVGTGAILSYDATITTKRVAIYKNVAEKVGIVLKDRDGNPVTHHPTGGIRLPMSDGSTPLFVNADDVPTPESVTIVPNFSTGDMLISPKEGKVFSNVTVTVPEGLEPQYIPEGMYIAGVGPGEFKGGGGGGGSEESGAYLARVVDYDGTVLAESYLEEGATFILPEAPVHDRLVFDGWSSPVELNGNSFIMPDYDVIIGANYYTASGVTEIDIAVGAITGLAITFYASRLTGMTKIEWGDGTSGTSLSHTYSSAGEYTIKIHGLTAIATGASYKGLVTLNSYDRLIKRVFFSKSVTKIGAYAFQRCWALEHVVLPASIATIETNAFSYNYALKCMVIPPAVTTVGDSFAPNAYSLKHIVIPRGMTTIGGDFVTYSSITHLTIPDSVISMGRASLSYNFHLKRIKIPDSVTTVDQFTFTQCRAMESLEVSSGVTTLPSDFFSSCSQLKRIVLRGDMMSIGTSAFHSAVSLEEVEFPNCTSVPKITSTNTFDCISATVRFKVPVALLDSWKAASYWSSWASQIVGV